jgi:hypothetical protein
MNLVPVVPEKNINNVVEKFKVAKKYKLLLTLDLTFISISSQLSLLYKIC